MRFEGIAAIRTKDDDTSTRLEHADHLADRGAVILYVFDHFMAEDQVEGLGRKRDEFPGGIEDVRGSNPRFGGALEVVFQSNDGSAKGGEVLHVHSHAATIFENFSFDTLPRGFDDHIKAALLPRPPDIGWFSAQGGFIQVSLSHGGNYILHPFLAHDKMNSYVELITARIEKWATPTFLLVIHRSIRSN